MTKRHNRTAPIDEYVPLHITSTGTNVPVGTLVATTATTAITAGQTIAVTPASMTNIIVGMQLNISHGSGGASEDVTVLSISSTQFTATFQNAHSGTYNICSWKSTFLKGITLGTYPTTSTITFTLYNGSQTAYFATTTTTPSAASTITVPVTAATLLPKFVPLPGVIPYGAFYSITGTGTAFDLTLWYADEY